ncbi:hypothetical protein BJ138DRAFT_1163523 [Hygrophoropsis aurantiaca]|uniref:Uncharacterized protein n=1 Tax=Hygrophoropsis aurantiaca TaxID=72124 RepID=A0ACB7ZZF8_9AGAM|nr:hypothetical protein BJ138DRAFT_1163523 [Hygrophoropsis aurantiaca]
MPPLISRSITPIEVTQANSPSGPRLSSQHLHPRGSSSAQPGSSFIPVPAIVGGTCAGIIIALAIGLGWKWWAGSANNNSQKNSGKRRRTLVKKRNHVFSDGGLTHPSRSPDSSMAHTFVEEKADPKLPSKSIPLSEKSAASSVVSFHTAEEAKHIQDRSPPAMPPEVADRPPSVERRISLARSDSNGGTRSSVVRSQKELSYKPSTIGSASVYSTQSGEEHQIRAPTSVVLAALGHTFDTKRLSTFDQKSESLPSNGETQGPSAYPRARMKHAAQSDMGINQLHRISQISAGSILLQPEDILGTPIGFAYGGEK